MESYFTRFCLEVSNGVAFCGNGVVEMAKSKGI